jgi:hypothetical protein
MPPGICFVVSPNTKDIIARVVGGLPLLVPKVPSQGGPRGHRDKAMAKA